MYPLDPLQHAASIENENPMAPPYVDRNVSIELTEMGMDVAEDEKRDAVVDSYEMEALENDGSGDSLDSISYPKGGSSNQSPELSAMKEVPKSSE